MIKAIRNYDPTLIEKTLEGRDYNRPPFSESYAKVASPQEVESFLRAAEGIKEACNTYLSLGELSTDMVMKKLAAEKSVMEHASRAYTAHLAECLGKSIQAEQAGQKYDYQQDAENIAAHFVIGINEFIASSRRQGLGIA